MGKVKKSGFGSPSRLTSVCIVLMASLHAVIGELCSFTSDPCICTTSTFELNLKSLMEAMHGVDLTATGDNGEYTYYVQPCNRKMSSPIPECFILDTNLISCQVHRLGYPVFGLGEVNKFDATKDHDDFVLTNTFTTFYDGKLRELHVTIKCSDQEAAFSYDGNSGPIEPIRYSFTLLTKHICGGGGIHIDVAVGLSAGSIMVIIFVVVIVVYFVGGTLFQKCVKKAEGTQIIPNVSFWTAIPSLAKDGVMFLLRGCKGGASHGQIK